MSRQNVKDLKVGDKVYDFYRAKPKRNKTTKNNKPFLDLDLADRTGQVNAKVWDGADSFSEMFQRGDVIRVKAVVEGYQGARQLTAQALQSAGARNVHHAYVGGLLEHTVKVARIAAFTAEELYPEQVDRDLLITGALLHDIGKMRELNSGADISYTAEGYLLGHVVMGALMLREKAAALADFPPSLLLDLEHVLLSHHGEREWGAPVVPM